MLILLKLLYAWLLPPGIFLLLLLAAWIACRKAKARCWIAGVIILLYLCSVRAVSDAIIKPLENAYPQPAVSELKNARAIVILAGGSYDGVPDFDGIGQDSESSTVRLAAGLRLHRVLHLPIIYSGGRLHDYTDTEANIGYRFLRACGVEEKNLIKEDRSRNTAENAKFTKEICKQKQFDKVVLVTSAFHMPRSVAFFEREGVEVIPYPTDYRTDKKLVLNAFAFTPLADSLYNVATAMKEYMGLLAVKFGWQ